MDRLHNLEKYAESILAVIIGAIAQVWFGKYNNSSIIKIIGTVMISSIFVALYLVPSLIDILNEITTRLFNFKISHYSNIAVMLYASSSLISIELINMIIKILPKAAEDKLSDFLGVNDATNDRK